MPFLLTLSCAFLGLAVALEIYSSSQWVASSACFSGCLDWLSLPSSLSSAYGFESGRDMFSSPPDARGRKSCAKPAIFSERFGRYQPWCFCPGPAEGWAYCSPLQLNCTSNVGNVKIEECDHADFLCGGLEERCVSFGGSFHARRQKLFLPNATFQQVDHIALTKGRCQAKDYFMQLKASGVWGIEGVRPHIPHLSAAWKTSTLVSLRLLQDKPCESPQDGVGCFNATSVLEEACPCDGADWGRGEDLHVDLNCPVSACPLVESELFSPRFFLFNASASGVCAFEEREDQERGWELEEGEDAGCLSKVSAYSCSRGYLGEDLHRK